MAFQGLTVALTTAPTLIAGDGTHGVIYVRIKSRGTGTAYLGGSDVTTAGYAMTTAEAPDEMRILVGEALYGTSTGAGTVNVLRFGETT